MKSVPIAGCSVRESVRNAQLKPTPANCSHIHTQQNYFGLLSFLMFSTLCPATAGVISGHSYKEINPLGTRLVVTVVNHERSPAQSHDDPIRLLAVI